VREEGEYSKKERKKRILMIYRGKKCIKGNTKRERKNVVNSQGGVGGEGFQGCHHKGEDQRRAKGENHDDGASGSRMKKICRDCQNNAPSGGLLGGMERDSP